MRLLTFKTRRMKNTTTHIVNRYWSKTLALLSGVLLLAGTGVAHAQVTGAGSTLVRELMAGWVTQYGPASGGVTYDATGS